MPESLFQHVLLPVADEDDAAASARAVRPYLRSAGGRATAVNVVEKAGGAPDKAGLQQREERAEKLFAAVRQELADVPVDDRIAYGTDVAGTVFDVARDLEATAVVFTPRGGSRWVRLLTGDVALDLVTDNDRPVVSLPTPDPGDADEDGTNAETETDAEAEAKGDANPDPDPGADAETDE